jgi:serine protease AprX
MQHSRTLHQRRIFIGGLLAFAVAIANVPGPAGTAEAAGRQRDATIDALVRDKAARDPRATIPVIIQYRGKNQHDAAVNAVGGRVKRALRLGHGNAAEVPAARLQDLARNPNVARISFDAPVRVTAADKPGQKTGQEFDPSRLQTVYPFAVGAPDGWRNDYLPVTGKGIGVAVLDSGLKDLPDFHTSCNPDSTTSRVVKRVAIALDSNGGPGDDNGHGTLVAGIVGGRGCGDPTRNADNYNYVGIAPDAQLIAVKVSDSNGMARISDVIAGIEWVIEHKDTYNIRVMNLSLTSSVAESYRTNVLNAAIEMAALKGILVVTSAGNAGPNSSLYAPANDPFVLTVGATDDKGTASTADDALATYSSYGTTLDGLSKPDLVAPGRRIVGPLAYLKAPMATLYPDRVLDNGYYIRMSGTSVSAPVVSGLAAQLLQAFPSLTASQLHWLLVRTARPLGQAGTGAGYPSLTTAGQYAYAGLYQGGAPFGRAHASLVPNQYVALAAYAAMTGTSTVSWEDVSWENVSWENVSWENVSWENVSWENVSWENVSWENVSWESVVRD